MVVLVAGLLNITMPPEKNFSFPFITREMLKFEQGSAFSLIVKSRGTATGRVTIAGTTREGLFTLKHTPSTNATEVVERFSMVDIPILFTILDVENLFRKGELYITVYLGINTNEIWQLAGGYVFGTKGLTWPTNIIEPPEPDFVGDITARSSANPAANTEISFTTSAAILTHFRAVQFTLVTDGTAANRRVHIVFQEAGGQEIEIFGSIDQVASTTRKYTCVPVGAGLAESNDDDIIIPIPRDIWIRSGGAFLTRTVNRQVGDDFGAAEFWVEEFIQVI